MYREVICRILSALESGEVPDVSPDDFRCFSEEGLSANPHLGPNALRWMAASWSKADIPTFERALEAIENGEMAWLGFKIVYDEPAALANNDIGVMKKFGDVGSADASDMVFFCNDAKEVVCSRKPSDRDYFQMKDATRGPGMHADQFAGLTWASVALFDSPAVWLLGASDLASEVAALADHVGFKAFVVDDDAAYLTEERFPTAVHVLLESWDDLAELRARRGDYACVLTMGHVHDVEACLWIAGQNMHYAGMLGCAGKNSEVYARCKDAGMTDDQWKAIKRPIGLAFGAKTPAELAIAIVGEMVDTRYKQRYSEEERARHDRDLGRI
ncbi:MAG: XdhC family protein [Eggerthellaceae bacterium]|nr:XdhC family protein [Eggerthellaceae bacterium]